MASKYDLLVIGSGPAGRAAAVECARAGSSVAIIEKNGFGGVCPLRGCNPKKVLVEAARTVHRARGQSGKGVAGEVSLDWKSLVAFERSFVEPVSDNVESWLNSEGIDTYQGEAVFTGLDRIRVGDEDLASESIFLGAGAKPRPLSFPGAEHVVDSADFFELEELPEEVIFIGGGFVSFEFAHVVARVGSRAVILHRSGQALKHFDSDLTDMLVEAGREHGVEVRLDSPVKSVESGEGRYLVRAGGKSFEAGLVVHGAGRVPDLAGLALDVAEVEMKEGFVKVDEYLRSTSNPRVFAGGDCVDMGPPLTPTADLAGKTAARNILEDKSLRMDVRGVPQTVFSIPPLAAVGMSESQALEEMGDRAEVVFKRTGDSFSTRVTGESVSGYKIIFDREDDLILGAHVLGPGADEIINVLGLAVRLGQTREALRRVLWAYPTHVYDVKHMVE